MLSTASRSENQLTVRDTAASQSTAGSQPMSVFAREMSAGVPRMSPSRLGTANVTTGRTRTLRSALVFSTDLASPSGQPHPRGRSSANATPMVRHDGRGGGDDSGPRAVRDDLGGHGAVDGGPSGPRCGRRRGARVAGAHRGRPGAVPGMPEPVYDLRPPRPRVAPSRHLPVTDPAPCARAARRLPDPWSAGGIAMPRRAP